MKSKLIRESLLQTVTLYLLLIVFIRQYSSAANNGHSGDYVIPSYLKKEFELFMKTRNKTSDDKIQRMNSSEYRKPEKLNETRSTVRGYLDEYLTLDALKKEDLSKFDSLERKFLTRSDSDTELVYTGMTMDPGDLFAHAENSEGWEPFNVNLEADRFKCPKCSKVFKTDQHYFDHIVKVENMSTPFWYMSTATCSYRYVRREITCPAIMCKNETFRDFGCLSIHVLMVHSALPHNMGLNSSEHLRPEVRLDELKARCLAQNVTIDPKVESSLLKEARQLKRNETKRKKLHTNGTRRSRIKSNGTKTNGTRKSKIFTETNVTRQIKRRNKVFKVTPDEEKVMQMIGELEPPPFF